ncbi:MAG TPA: ANTAR domain-containing protein [Stellaceae bacterium]|nr:ANTAR domain-containing protein [Stellaceae bacterium]
MLLADTDSERARIMEAQLGTGSIVKPAPDEPLAEAVQRLHPDAIIVGMTRPDRDGLDGIRRAMAQEPRAIVLFVDRDDPDFMEEAISAGISSYNVVGAEPPDIKPIVQSAMAMFRRFQRVSNDLRRIEGAIADRTIVEKAKGLLIRQRQMSESDAHRWLQRQAMNRSRRIIDVARELVAGTDAGGQETT